MGARALIGPLPADGEQTVSALVTLLNVSQPAVSQQLAVLKSAALVEERQEGRFRYYRLCAAPLLEVQSWVDRYRALLEAQLDALGRVLDEMDDGPPTVASIRRRRKK